MAAGGGGEVVGGADTPGCVPGGALGGLMAAAGWRRISEVGPATGAGFGVPLGCGDADGAAGGAAAFAGAAAA